MFYNVSFWLLTEMIFLQHSRYIVWLYFWFKRFNTFRLPFFYISNGTFHLTTKITIISSKSIRHWTDKQKLCVAFGFWWNHLRSSRIQRKRFNSIFITNGTFFFVAVLFHFTYSNEYFKIEPQAIWMITRRHPDAGKVKEVLYREVSKAAQIDNTPAQPPLSSIIHGLKWVDQCTKKFPNLNDQFWKKSLAYKKVFKLNK